MSSIKITIADCLDYIHFSDSNFNNPITVCQNTSTNLFAENCPINGASGTSYIQWHSIFGGNDVMFASNIANNLASSNYQNFTFTSIGQYQIYYEIGNMVAGVFVPSGGVSFGSYLLVNVVNEIPTGNFVSPFNLCENSAFIQFNYTGTAGIIDYTLSTIDLGDGNGPQVLTSFIFGQLTGFGLNTYYMASNIPYTVTLVLVNVCGSATFTQSYMVYDQTPITTNDVSICEGTQSVNLSANVPNGATVEWFSNGNFIDIGNPLTIVAPSATTTYTATASIAGGCSNSANLTVTVILEQTIQIEGPPTNCNTQSAIYTIQNQIPGVIYTWNVTNGTPSTATGDQINITWDQNNLALGGQIEISAANYPCLLTNIIDIEPCCINNEISSFVIDGESDNNLGTNEVYLSQYFANGTNLIGPTFTYLGFPYNRLVLGGSIKVDININLSNDLIVDMMPNTSIEVLSGYTLTIENGTVLKAACKEMWQGIRVLGGSSLVLNSGCIIQDAEVGVITATNGMLNFGASGAKVRFNKNYVGLFIINHNAPNNLSIKNTVFECRTGTYSSDELLLSPYSGEMSAIGIFLRANIPTITIGQATANFQNVFDNLLFGIQSIQSNFTLHNNLFQNISFDVSTQSTNYDCGCRCPYGTAVCADGGNAANGFIANIGDNGAAKNIVTNSFGGFYLYRNMNAVITNNDMLNIESNGMQLFQNYASNGFYDVNHNNLKDVQDHNILIFDNPKIIKDVYENEINESYTPQNYLYSTGINIVEFVKPIQATNIFNNQIRHVKFGITTNLVYSLTIDHNEIDLSTDPLAVYGAGIKVEHSQKNTITNNTIRAAHRNNWWVDGIRLEFTPKTTVSCNIMERTASGVFLNGDCSDSRIFQNNFRRNYWGYIINGAITGLQQPNMYSDNIWTGPYDVNTDWMGGTYWHTLNQNSNVLDNEMNVRPAGTHTVYKPLPFYANDNFGNTQLLQPDPVFPTVGPIFYSNLENNNNDPFYDVCAAVADSSDGDENMIQQIVSGNYQSPQYNEETNWWLQYQLYIRALSDSTLTNQYSLQQFIDSMQQASAGRLEHIGKQMTDSTFRDSLALSQLRAENQAIGTFNSIEEHFKWVNEKNIDATIAELDSTFTAYNFNTTDMQTLEALAWDCPFDKGPAVFAARALMIKLNPNAPSFINVCETIQADENNQRSGAPIVYEYEYDPTEVHDMDALLKQDNSNFVNELKLYPNPSNSMVTLESAEPITRVEISTTLGQVILIDKGAVANIKSFNLKDLPKGLYLIKVYNHDNFAVKQLSLID